MSKEICISTTPHETRLAILEDDELAEIYYERENEYTLAGSIYKGRVTRVLPGMQSAFVDLGLERDAFLYVTDFLEEQEDGADFEQVGGRNGHSQPAREHGREGGREGGRGRQPQEESVHVVSTEQAVDDSAGDEESPSGTRRWRGRRGRRRGFRPRSHQEESQRLESPEAIEESIAAEPVALPEHGAPGGTAATNRILLPGESLSKYGSAPAPETKKPESALPATPVKTNYTAPKPSTLIETPLAWDGGSLLPGESRARFRNVESQAVAIAEPPVVEETTPAETENEETGNATAEAHVAVEHHEVGEPETSVSGLVIETGTADSHAEVAAGASVEQQGEPNEEAVHPVVEAVPLVHEVEETVSEAHEHEAHAPETHAEVHPVQEEIHAHHEPELHEEVHEFEPQEFEPETASASHRVDPVAPSEFRVPSVAEEETHSDVDLSLIAHEIREEGPIDAHAAETTVEYESEEADTAEPEAVNEVFAFAPGAGLLEEEVIDEDEYDFEPIRRHVDEQDIEDLEEETLENAGPELGEMVREAHLNQRLLNDPSAVEAGEDEAEELEFGDAEIEEREEDEDEDHDEEEFESESEHANGHGSDAVASDAGVKREGDRRGERRGDRRGDRRGRQQGRKRHGGRRPSMQTSDLPIISELLKQGQEILVQIAKEPIAKKGARITSHIALPGRFLVFMPTVNHVGVSRKISSDEERQRLKRILISEKGTASGGFIVRTAADGASEDELRADLRFLISLWNDIKQRADDSKAPALIYHDLNLVERVLRDQVSDNFSTIWVDSEAEYERTVRFLNRFQPSLVRRVKLYTKETPLFEQFGIQDEISKALKSKVWLKSGGSIVINQTEALVAIDINTGKYVGKTARLEDTILKTNLDAIPEIVRQIRLRDLGGIIVIDFIDMDERKNRHKVMQALEEALKADRAPSKVLQFNDFGLVAITRKRVKQSLERTLSIPCPICTATGMVKSPTTVANEIYIELRKMQRHLDRGDVMLRVNPEVVKTLKANNARWLNEMEEMLGKTIIVKSDPALHPEQFDIH